jgi:predicted phage-related endonuclease
VPPYALLQVQWELLILGQTMGIRRAVVAAPLDGDLVEYVIDADEELQARLVEEAERFWRDHVERRVPPAPDASPSYGEWLKRRFPKSDEQFLLADAEAVLAAEQLKKAREAKRAAEEAEERARQVLEMKIGESAGLIGPDFRVSWKLAKGRPVVDWKALCMELQVPPAVVERHTKRAPYRVFRPQFAGVASNDD